MSVDTHRHFHEELAQVKSRLLTMSGEAEAALELAVEALLERSAAKAAAVITGDRQIDALEVEIEEQVALDSLPSTVKAKLQAKAGGGKIVKVESLTKHDKLVAYEAKVQTAGKKTEIQVGPDGKPLDHEE